MATRSASPEQGETEVAGAEETTAPALIPAIPPTEKVQLKDIQGVRYVGTADTKTLTVKDLESVGVKADHDLSWDKGNDHFVDKEEFNAATLAWLVDGPELFRAER